MQDARMELLLGVAHINSSVEWCGGSELAESALSAYADLDQLKSSAAVRYAHGHRMRYDLE